MINIKNIKIRIKDKEESIKVQTQLFKMGCVWNGDKSINIQYTDVNFLFCDNNFYITFTTMEEFFNEDKNREIKVEDLFKHNTLKGLLED